MSFLEKEDEKPSALWDWIIGIGLLLLVAGFTVFYQYQKRYSRERFYEADRLFQAGQYGASASLYRDLKNAQYLTTTHDSLIYARLDSVESMEEREVEVLGRLRAKLAVGDTAGARAELSAPFRGLLPAQDQAFLDSIQSAFKTR